MRKKVLISVSDKSNLEIFASRLKELGYDIICTGNTFNYLKDLNIEAEMVEEVTGCKELLNGKVKTLHPNIFAGILNDRGNRDEANELKQANIENIDMVVVNLYPFEKIVNSKFDIDTLIRNIDIGGVALLRAGAKNCKDVIVVSSPNQYERVLSVLELGSQVDDSVVRDLKKDLGLEAFELTSKYDHLIGSKLSKLFFPDRLSNLCLINKPLKRLRYGENPHQESILYKTDRAVDFEILNGKELSYNNYLDMTASINIVSEFYDVNACAIVKHNTPCGVALGDTLESAYDKALDCDPISTFGGIVAFTGCVDVSLAKKLTKIFLEVIIAPDFEEEAIEILKIKKNLRIIKFKTELKYYRQFMDYELKVTPFGILRQSCDNKELDKNTFRVVTKTKPTKEMIEDLIFAFKVVKYVKSNGIVIAKDFKTLGICAGQTSRIDALEIALNRACDGSKDAVLASDGFFPAIDNINSAAQGRISAIIQPGGSIKDVEVIEQCDKFSISMIMTGVRHFLH